MMFSFVKVNVVVDADFDIFKTPVRYQMTIRDVLMVEGKDVEILNENELSSYFKDLAYAPERQIDVNVKDAIEKDNMKV